MCRFLIAKCKGVSSAFSSLLFRIYISLLKAGISNFKFFFADIRSESSSDLLRLPYDGFIFWASSWAASGLSPSSSAFGRTGTLIRLNTVMLYFWVSCLNFARSPVWAQKKSWLEIMSLYSCHSLLDMVDKVGPSSWKALIRFAAWNIFSCEPDKSWKAYCCLSLLPPSISFNLV